MSTIPQSSEVRTTRYTIKANVETTRYFESPETDIEQQVNQNTEDIATLQAQLLLKENVTDHDEDISILNTSIAEINETLSTKENINEHNSDITNLQSQINSKESISSHNSDISNLQSQINSIQINPYEGLYKPIYISGDFAIIEYNYNLGNMIYWLDDSANNIYRTAINNYDSRNNIQISNNARSLTIPGIIKKINSNGSTNKIINKIRYTIDRVLSTSKLLNNLTSLIIMPDVYGINFDCLGTPNLSSLNLFNGLQELSLSNAYNINYLKIPASVKECSISNCIFMDLSFEPSNIELKLTYTDNRINNKLKIMRKLSSDSSINVSNSSSIDYPPSVLECDVRVLLKIANNSSLSNGRINIDTFTQLNLRCMAFDNTPVYSVSLNHPLKFNRILVLCQLQIYVGVANLTANEWYTVA